MRIKININLKVNRVIKYFVITDLMLFSGWGLVDPVFGIFIVEKITGATVATVGVAAAIYWLLKSVIQLPIANYLDRNAGEKDDLITLIASLILAGLAAFSFILVDNVWELYIVQIFHAAAFALYVPSWSSIFSRHLDKDRISFDWSLDSTTVGIASGISGLLGAAMAETFGFRAVFLLAGIMSAIGVIFLAAAPEFILPSKTASEPEIMMKDHIGK